MTTIKAAYRTADGLRVRYAEAGQEMDDTVVLTNPWPESLFAFRKVWDRLAEHFYLVAIDLPGFGQSEWRWDLRSLRPMGGGLVQLVQEWEWASVHFGGAAVRRA